MTDSLAPPPFKSRTNDPARAPSHLAGRPTSTRPARSCRAPTTPVRTRASTSLSGVGGHAPHPIARLLHFASPRTAAGRRRPRHAVLGMRGGSHANL